MIAIVDYKVGNIRSVMFALQRLSIDVRLTSAVTELEVADGIILPGVGAFSLAMQELKKRKLAGPLRDMAGKGKPLLGICVGHQLLFSESEEFGLHQGLGLVAGRVTRFGPCAKIPHMGWNQVHQVKDSVLFDGIENDSFFYFAHSYYTEPADDAVSLGKTEYGPSFTACVQWENIFGVQFHPEKSGEKGERMLANFCRYCEQ